jgi:hypothetical protein
MGVAPKTLDWFVCEALQGDIKNIIVDPIANDTFPLDFNRDQDMEPVGKYYQVYSSWGRITQELKKKRDKSSLLSKGSSNKNSHDNPPSSQEDEVIVVDDLDGIGNGGAASRRCQMQVSL